MENEGHTQIAVSVPLFLKKLWKMVNDQEAEDIIGWNSTGDGFVIYDQLQFITKLLPQYFKHNNMASFIRQLNFYDFHKVSSIDKDEIHFSHNCFLKDLPETLIFIKRKCVSMRSKLTNSVKEEELSELLSGVKELKTKHSLVDNELKLLKQENAALWSEINNLRVKHSKQTNIINKIIHFLISYIHSQNSMSKRNSGTRKGTHKNIKTGPTILEIGYHNHDHQEPNQAKQNSYTVPESSGAITYNIESENVANTQPDAAASINEILTTNARDKVPSSVKWVTSNTPGDFQANTSGNYNIVSDSLKRTAVNPAKQLVITMANSDANNLRNPKREILANTLEAENSILEGSRANAENSILVGSKADAVGPSKNNLRNTATSNAKYNVGNSTATSLNQTNKMTTKSSDNLNEDFGIYFSNESTSLPAKNLIQHGKILENPKEHLGVYLDNTQMELNTLQDMLNNLSSDELSNICNLVESVDPEINLDTLDADAVNTDIPTTEAPSKKGQQGSMLGRNIKCENKDINEFADLPAESNLNEVSDENVQFTQDNVSPEDFVDEFFNSEY
ncbi:hypothetical protein NQ318_008949 [Aromia moschata]|uniref:HSF-type DNA-binding domain-containing protein n=1 Tax=Aromia moschata TaxID=1265417 RepID=A0AAV8ZDJ9_9CUCU|nr:hypothetical protein NQ318_008949 [Aromia moschata]